MTVTRFEIDRREPVLGDSPFGAAGPYEKIIGTLHFAVDPSARVHENIVDLARAPRNAQGHVECSAGFTVAWIGWQPDVPRQDGMMALTVPRVAEVSGRIRCEFRPNTHAASLPLADRYHIPHPVDRPDDPEHELTVRAHTGAPEMPVPRSAWRFARVQDGKLVADPSHVALDGGFEPGMIYDCYYRAVDPPVVGLGFVAVRDG